MHAQHLSCKRPFEIKQNLTSRILISIFYGELSSLMPHFGGVTLKLDLPTQYHEAEPPLFDIFTFILISSAGALSGFEDKYSPGLSGFWRLTFSKKDLFSSNGVMEWTSLRKVWRWKRDEMQNGKHWCSDVDNPSIKLARNHEEGIGITSCCTSSEKYETKKDELAFKTLGSNCFCWWPITICLLQEKLNCYLNDCRESKDTWNEIPKYHQLLYLRRWHKTHNF